MALDTDALQIAEGPGAYLFEIACYNASTTTAIDAYSCVMIDTANIMNDSGNSVLAVTLPATTTPSVCIGVTQTSIPALGTGRVRWGGLTNAVAYGTVTAGTVVDNCTVTSYTGRVQTHTVAQHQLGIALATANDGETLPVLLALAKDA